MSFKWTIGRKLQLLVLLTLLPTFSVSGFLSLRDLYSREMQAIEERTSREAGEVADRVDQFVVAAGQGLITLAEVPAVRERNAAQTAALLSRLKPQYRYFDNLVAVGPDGLAYATATPSALLPLYVGDRDYFKTAVNTGSLAVSPLIESRLSGELVVIFAYPVWDAESQIGGIVASSISGKALQQIIAVNAPPNASVTVVAFDGQVIARYPDPSLWVGRHLSLAEINPKIPGQFAGVWEGTLVDETPRVLSYHTAKLAPWRVFVGIPASEAYAPLGRALGRSAIGVTLIFLFAMAVSIVLSRRLTGPLQRLAAAAHGFGSGKLPGPVPVQGQDEVAELSTTFNKMLADLERHIAETSALQAVREADRLKSELLASVSHELKTPLGSIKGFASALQQDDVALDRATERDFLATIEADADRLTNLVEDLLDMSRIEAGALRLDREPCSVRELVASTQARLKRQLGDRQLRVLVPPGLPPVLVDPVRIEQVIFNLLDNAIKYSPTGSSIKVRAALVAPSAETPAGLGPPVPSVAISVCDEGIGIPDEQLERVFERFWRTEGGRRHRASGTGLGLAICKGILQAHGGQIWAANEPGCGCCVTFVVPVAAGPTLPPAPHRPPSVAGVAPSATTPGTAAKRRQS